MVVIYTVDKFKFLVPLYRYFCIYDLVLCCVVKKKNKKIVLIKHLVVQ